MKSKKALIIGLGSIGRRHAKILLDMGHEVYALRHSHDSEPMDGVIDLYDNGYFVDVISFSMVLVCNPTDMHIKTIFYNFDKVGAGIFIEKPIDCSVKNIKELAYLTKFMSTYVAYPLRHHPQVKKAKALAESQHIHGAHFSCRTDIAKWGKEYSKRKATGGGALLELSHEIDLAAYLMGPIKEIKASKTYGGTFTDAEISAGVHMVHESGCSSYTSLHIESKYEERAFVLDTDGGPVIFDLTDKAEIEQAYRNQMEYFIANLGNLNMMNNIREAKDVFLKIMEVR